MIRIFRTEEIKNNCLLLRKEKRLSIKSIQRETGIPKSTLQGWLKEFPLTIDEKRKRYAEAGRRAKKPRGEKSKYWSMLSKDVSSAQRGKVSEAAILFRLSLLGMNVFSSVFDGDKIDYIVEVPNSKRLIKIQVKTVKTACHCGLPTVSIRCANGRNKLKKYSQNDFDILVGYDLYTDKAYVYNWNDINQNSTSITISSLFEEKWEKLTGM